MKCKVVSVELINNKKIGIVRTALDSFQIIADKNTGITEIWKARFKELNYGYEEEIFPQLILKCETKKLKSKYKTPMDMIQNYLLLNEF